MITSCFCSKPKTTQVSHTKSVLWYPSSTGSSEVKISLKVAALVLEGTLTRWHISRKDACQQRESNSDLLTGDRLSDQQVKRNYISLSFFPLIFRYFLSSCKYNCFLITHFICNFSFYSSNILISRMCLSSFWHQWDVLFCLFSRHCYMFEDNSWVRVVKLPEKKKFVC